MSSVSNVQAAGQFQIAVARKQLDSVELQGQNALALLAAAEPPGQAAPQNVQPGVATQLNVVA
jgi:hypothetical protein